ncbi:hypothetical protein GGR54DRAFT_640358 [Hypoxylon sp. NC1633]|nr:hypothetical protein GGR54DRAFT_640358 [Hypoxylon sp. NC1633]
MAPFNPLQFLIFPFLFFVALPLALCAGFTTILAFMVLFLRLFLVYFDVGLETLRYVLLGHGARTRSIASQRTPLGSVPTSTEPSPPSSPEARYRRRRKRHGSISSGSVTPIGGLDGLALTPSVGFERDFEGIGGWRLDRVDVDADADADARVDRQWYNLNSRLEIPDRRHHFRSQSGGAVLSGASGLGLYTKGGNTTTAYSPDSLRVYASANNSSSRTPSGRPHGLTKPDQDGYFPMLDGSGAHAKKSRC